MVTKVQRDKAEKEKSKKIRFELTLTNALFRFINLISREIIFHYEASNQILDLNIFLPELKGILSRSYTNIQNSTLKTEVMEFEKIASQLLDQDITVTDTDLVDLTKIVSNDVTDTTAPIILTTMQKKLNDTIFEMEAVGGQIRRTIQQFKIEQKLHVQAITANTQVQSSFETIKSDTNSFLITRYASGLISSKVWVTVGDDKVRLLHREANGQIVPSNQKFTVGPDKLRFPGDPTGTPANVIGCRCSSVHTFARA